jgi:type III restriction enzyme
MIQELADVACERITSAVTRAHEGETGIKALLDPYTPTGSTRFVSFRTSKTDRWETDPRICHVNWAILDSDWEAEFCRVVEAHPRVRAYVKNHNLGLEVPYQLGGQKHRYRPDFILQVDDGHDDPLNLVVEIKGYRGEDAKAKKETMLEKWVPGVNRNGSFGRWAFAELRHVFQMREDFDAAVEEHFDAMLAEAEVPVPV